MSDYSDFTNHIPTPKLDPLSVGEIMGTDAFSEGDWVLLRYWDNRPTKVTQVQDNFVYVGLDGGETFEDAFVHFYPEELGYPLDHRFWSKHQQKCYLRCHIDRNLIRQWDGNSQVFVEKDTEFKVFLLSVFAGIVALAVSGLWMHYQVFRGISNGMGHPMTP